MVIISNTIVASVDYFINHALWEERNQKCISGMHEFVILTG